MLILIRYGEIALKGKNRGMFEKKLMDNIRLALREISADVTRIYGRLLVEASGGASEFPAIAHRLGNIFGIISFSPVEAAPLNHQAITEKASEIMYRNCKPPFSFKIETKRPNKAYPLPSPQVSAEVGAFILEHVPGSKVDVHQPEITLNIEIREKEAYLYHRFYPGQGGFPVGVSGKALLLLSGGIDSPVAGWMGMKRGLTIEALYFHSHPFVSERAKEKVIDIAKLLSRYSPKLTLHIAGFTDIQKAIRQNCPPAMSITIMRRMMLRIATELANRRKALALITGESLGQVASQTINSIYVINKVTDLPVFRPLIGMDKLEIIALARRIESYPISILPYEDCCTIFLPENPETKPDLARVEKAETYLPVEDLVKECVESIESLSLASGN